MKILISWAHNDCTYSLLKVLEKIPRVEVYIPDYLIDGFITFLLDYEKWPINEFNQIIKPLSSLNNLNEIDFYVAEIVDLVHDSDGFSDSQIEWGLKNIGKQKILLYSYNVISFDNFKYKHEFPLITTCKKSYLSYKGPKCFWYGETKLVPFSHPKNFNSYFLIQNSFEIQKKGVQKLKQILLDYRFSNFDIRYYGFTDDPVIKKLNYAKGERLNKEEVDNLIKNEMTLSLHLKDHEGYGYHPLKCLFAGRPVINFNENVKGMTYEDYLINDITSLLVNDLDELLAGVNWYQKNDRILRFSERCYKFVNKYFNFAHENDKVALFLKKSL